MKIKLTIIFLLSFICISSIDSAAQNRGPNHERNTTRKALRDSIFTALSDGVLDMEKITYKSSEEYLEIPAYMFSPLEKRGDRGHPALIWVHGGVHGDLDNRYFPFIKEAVNRGYVVIAPEYRGSTGYGQEFYERVDYGGFEVEDCISAYDHLKARVPYVDPARVAMIGWSHGGFITLHALERVQNLFKVGVAIVPVTNMIQRLSWYGPRYSRYFVEQERVGGETWERQKVYIERSPLYHVEKIEDPVLVHIARNDGDVFFEEAEQIVNKLNVVKPFLSETKIYDEPAGGHSFNRQVDSETWQRMDSPEQRDSWNRIWQFLEWHLRPYEGK